MNEVASPDELVEQWIKKIDFDDLLEQWIKEYDSSGCARFEDGDWHYIDPSFDLFMFGKKFDEWIRERYYIMVSPKPRGEENV